jgi:ABC-type sugar transport system permease subunit
LFRAIFLSFHLTNLRGEASLFVGWENYAYMLTSSDFWNSLKVTFLFVLYTVPVSVVIGLFLALLANEQLKGRGIFRVLFSTTKVVSGGISAIIWLFLFNPQVGFINNIINKVGLGDVPWLTDGDWALISVAISTNWLNIGFAFLIYLGGLQGVDLSWHDSAAIDGGGYWKRLIHITLPMVSPTTFFLSTVMLIGAFQSFAQVDLMTGGGPNNSTNLLGYAIYREAFVNYQFGTANALALILFIIMLFVTLLQFKFSESKVHYQ